MVLVLDTRFRVVTMKDYTDNGDDGVKDVVGFKHTTIRGQLLGMHAVWSSADPLPRGGLGHLACGTSPLTLARSFGEEPQLDLDGLSPHFPSPLSYSLSLSFFLSSAAPLFHTFPFYSFDRCFEPTTSSPSMT